MSVLDICKNLLTSSTEESADLCQLTADRYDSHMYGVGVRQST